MAQLSIIQRASLEKTRRIDPEYYQPAYLESYERLVRTKASPLSKVANVSDGNHLTIAERFQGHPGVRYLRGQDVSTEMMIEDRNEVYIPEDVYNKIERSHIVLNDVLITIVGANTGLIGLAYDVPSKLSASCKLGIARAYNIEPGYLYAFLISRFGQHQIRRNKRGGGQTGLILPDMRELRIARLPSLEEKIAALTLKGHEERKRARNLYVQAERLLLSELGLQDWKPAHILAFIRNYSLARRSRRIDAEFFQPKFKQMFDKLPPSVSLSRLGRLTALTKGIEVGSSSYTDSGAPFWRVSNLSKHGLDLSNLNYVSSERYDSLQTTYEPKQGEILLSKDATPGIAFYLESPIRGIISGGILRLTLIDKIQPHYLELVLNSPFVQLQIEQEVGGSILKHWKPGGVKKTWIPRLSMPKETELAGLISQSHAARREAKRIINKAKNAVELAIERSLDEAREYLR